MEHSDDLIRDHPVSKDRQNQHCEQFRENSRLKLEGEGSNFNLKNDHGRSLSQIQGFKLHEINFSLPAYCF